MFALTIPLSVKIFSFVFQHTVKIKCSAQGIIPQFSAYPD